MKKTLFCAQCQAETQHAVVVTRGDFVFTCDCGRFTKFPATMTPMEISAAIAAHKENNQGLRLIRTEADQIEAGGMSMSEVDAALAKLTEIS